MNGVLQKCILRTRGVQLTRPPDRQDGDWQVTDLMVSDPFGAQARVAARMGIGKMDEASERQYMEIMAERDRK